MKRGIRLNNALDGPPLAITQEMSPIHNSRLAFDILKPYFNAESEEFWLLSLNAQLQSLKPVLISRGTLNYCPVHPRDLFREALKANAYALIIAHNHPSLDPTPTVEDIKLTKRLSRLSRLLEIPILDHIIFTGEKYYSFKENSLI